MSSSPHPVEAPSSIAVDDPQAVSEWARKFDVSAEQIREAVDAVGDRPENVEMHLKGTRSTTNAEVEASAEEGKG